MWRLRATGISLTPTILHATLQPTEAQAVAAEKVIDTQAQSADLPEAEIHSRLVSLLNTFEIESISEYATSIVPADLYLPQRRIFIEVKRTGKARQLSTWTH